MFAFYDIKAQIYTIPFYQQREEMAIRAFADMINDSNHAFGKNPGDYSLLYLGEYDDETGIIESDVLSIADGKNVLRPTGATQ